VRSYSRTETAPLSHYLDGDTSLSAAEGRSKRNDPPARSGLFFLVEVHQRNAGLCGNSELLSAIAEVASDKREYARLPRSRRWISGQFVETIVLHVDIESTFGVVDRERQLMVGCIRQFEFCGYRGGRTSDVR
jgi:hypothetical protein